MLERPPSAELRPDQLDEDSLPPYEVLDRILEAYVERDEGIEALVAAGSPRGRPSMEVVRLVDRAEYKRRQAPPGIRISTKAFGRDRRLPITNRFGSMRSPLAAARGRDLMASRLPPGPTAIVIRERAQTRPSSSRHLDVPDPGRPAPVARRAPR